MKIAIHQRTGSYSDRWISYCDKNNIPYKIVNCYDFDIISQLRDCNGLMWHWDQNDYKAVLFARQLTISLEKIGLAVFPNINTAWHFDDKVGQKYLLEAINAPLVQSYIFYTKSDAIKWIDTTIFPKVFKLRGGASSVNVQLVKNKKKAKSLIRKAFGKGFLSIDRFSRLKNRFWQLKRDKNIASIKQVIKGFGRVIIPTVTEKFAHKQKGYIYFQDFIQDNAFDTRMVVIGDRCFALRRYCRTGDFRASGSGIIAYNPEYFDKKMIKTSFEISTKLETQSLALDFIWEGGNHKLVEISYCFIMGRFYDDCPGYWDNKLNWHSSEVNPQIFMIEDFIEFLLENEEINNESKS